MDKYEFDFRNQKQVAKLLRQHYKNLGVDFKGPDIALFYTAACAYLKQFAAAREELEKKEVSE